MDLQRTSMGLTGKTALVIVDMINGFTDPACPLGCSAPQVVKANQQLLDKCRELGLPVFYTTVVYHNDQQAPVFRQRVPDLNVLTPGSHWIEIDPALQPRPGEIVIEKQWASGFHKTAARRAGPVTGGHRAHHQRLRSGHSGRWPAV